MRLLLLAVVFTVISCQNHTAHLGEFMGKDSIAAFSGMHYIFSDIPPFDLFAIPFKLIPGTLMEVEMVDIQANVSKLVPTKVECIVEAHQAVAACTGVGIHLTIKFKYIVRSDMQLFAGSANVDANATQAKLHIHFTVTEKKAPLYKPDIDMNFVVTKFNASGEPGVNEALEYVLNDDVKKDFIFRVKDYLITKAQKHFDALTTGYDLTYRYEYKERTIDVDYRILKANSSMLGITYEIDGGIPGIKPGPGNMTEVDATNGQTQMIVTRQFALELVNFANKMDFFDWTFSPGTLILPSFDFRVADIWVIFPDSRDDFAAMNPLLVNCYGDRNAAPTIEFLEATQRIRFGHKFICSVECNNVALLNLTFTSKFDLNFDVTDATNETSSKVIVTTYAVQYEGASIVFCKYPQGHREQGIIDSIIKEGLEKFSLNQPTFGTGYELYGLVTMQQSDYKIDKHQLIIFGEPADVKKVPRSKKRTTTPTKI